ncbi:uncharacterized protein LOC129798622 [Phlebotomus papatasi]|uniref:uncharacterized protein LOC129798622 n=1 Tax=Phlebotomus papatasi TaxID=29031 RepID=UPI002484304A|nr:uncharacterized protein LOC129798622 [Phlebotomus papatasi]
MNIPQYLAIFFAFTIDFGGAFAESDEKVREREKRFLAFPINSATGVLVAIAVPLIIPHRNVFVSYNFEANYNMPTTATDLIPGPLDRLEIIDRSFGASADIKESDREIKEHTPTTTEGSTTTPKMTKTPQKRSTNDSLFSRKKIYRMLESKLQCHGHRGRACLLRAICEEAENPINEHNGVLGDVIHIILTPSTSIREDLHPEYYKAEDLGRSGDCSKYKKYCPECILDYISKII